MSTNMGSWKNDEVFKRFIGTWEVDPGTETEKERENLEKYLEAIVELPRHRDYFRDKSTWSMTTDEGGTWVMDSFLSATPETIVVSLDVDPVAETILRHRSVTTTFRRTGERKLLQTMIEATGAQWNSTIERELDAGDLDRLVMTLTAPRRTGGGFVQHNRFYRRIRPTE